MLTDGEYNEGGDPVDAANRCAEDGFVIHTITFSDDANTTDMETVASNTGGTHHHADTESELIQIFEQVAGSFAILTQ